MGFSPDESVKAGARLVPPWSSVCVGVDTRQEGQRADLPKQDMLDMRAARVACRSLLLNSPRSRVCEQLPVWPKQCELESCYWTR